MPESSIVVTLVDRYSDSAKKMTTVTRAFSKDVDELEDQLQKLNKNKYSLKVDAQKAKQALKEAEKQFAATGKEADGLKVEMAMANYDNIVKQINLVSKAAQEGERRLQKMGDAASKEENRAGKGMLDSIKGIFSGDGIGGKLASSGIYKMLGDSVAGAIGIGFESTVGQPMATLGSSLISGVTSGASAGAIFGPYGAIIGTAIGAAVGAGVGLINGATQAFEQRDDAFKSYVQEAYEGQMSAQEASLTSGSALAAQRETDRISFETLFRRGGPGAEHRRHGGHGHGHRADEVQQQGHTGVSEYPERPGHRRGGDAGGGQGCRPGRHVRHDLQGAGVRPGGTAESGMT